MLRYRQHDRAAVLCAFDLIELDGEDLRRAPLEHRKRALAKLLRQKRDGIVLNAYCGDGATRFPGPSPTSKRELNTRALAMTTTGVVKNEPIQLYRVHRDGRSGNG